MPSLIDFVGIAAGASLILSFAMKKMFPLRLMAYLSAGLILTYGLLVGNMLITGIGLAWGIVNFWRMMQIVRLSRRMGTSHRGRFDDFTAVQSFGTQVDIASGAAVFRRGEPVDAFYVIESGKVQLQEVGVDLGPGDILGELGFFTDAETRTATAVCIERTRVHMLTEDTFRQLQFQDPSFGMAVMRTATRRLADGMARNPAAYHGLVAPLRRE